MTRIVIALLSFLFLAPQGLRATAQLQTAAFSKVPLTSCNVPASSTATTFSATDTAVYVFFDVSGVNAGDTFLVAFYGPSGQLYTGAGGTSNFSAAPSAGEACYVTNNSPLLIAGNPAASMPGNWTVAIFYNGIYTTAFASGTFTITASATCSYLLSGISTSSPGLIGGSFNVITSPGCAWTAISNASWITITPPSSGTGNGTVNFTAQPNPGTTSRSGTITVNGQTFTVTQTGTGTPSTTYTVTLTPATDSNPVGTQHTVTAKVTDANSVAQANVSVTFTILSGPNAGATGVCSPSSCKTDSSGQVSFTYTGSSGAGQDSIKACVSTTVAGQACCSTPLDGMAIVQPEAAKSAKVVFIGGDKVDASCSSASANRMVTDPCIPVTGAAGELGDFTFTGLAPANVTAANLSQYDTAVLNVASPIMNCDMTKLSTQAKADLVSFVGGGKKLIILDSECQASGGKGMDYSWLPYPFTTSNPGQAGAQGTLNIVENSSLASSVTGSASFVDANDLGKNTDAVGDMNVMTSKDAHWCLAMSGTNTNNVTGPTLAYAKYPAGTDAGLFIYNGLDHDEIGSNANLRKVWVLELQQAFNPSNLPCGVAVVGITASPATATNQVGTTHTVTAKVVDQTGKAQSAITVTFTVTGTNASASGTCNPSGCKTDATGQVAFTYTGSKGVGQDTITACFTPAGGTTPVCAAPVTKTWVTQSTGTQTCSPVVTKTWTSGGGTTPGCNYRLSSLSEHQPATGTGGGNITGLITIVTNTNCAWTAVRNNSWITILAGAAGTGSGAVSYKVDPNTATTSRQGSMTIADGQVVTVTQDAGVACSYSISPTSNTMQSLGGTSAIALTAGSACSWTASVSSSASSWLHLGSITSGTGNGSVSYTADANTSTISRTGTITIAGATFTLTQAGGASATGPTIPQGGISNAVNYRPAIAQGSFFTIFGKNLGPTQYLYNYVFPIPKNLGGVTVDVRQGSSAPKSAYLVFVSETQINAIMPSDAPVGDVQVTVYYNGSATQTATVVKTAFGMNSTANGSGPGIIKNYNSDTDQPLPIASTPAKPGQTEIMVGTGLGAITTGDDQPPPALAPTTPVQVLVGGKQANVTYHGRAPGMAGQDQINFVVPADAPFGCSIPVQVSAGGVWSNTVRMAISADGSHCQDTSNPYAGLSSTGGKSGTLGLIRVKFSGQVDPTQPPTNATLDLGFGAFATTSAGSDYAYSPITNLPPPGTCAATNKALDLGAVMGAGGSSLDPTVGAALDAGAQLTVTGGAGGASGAIAQSSPTSPYMGLLGGILNVSGSTLPPPFLDGGPFTITGPGGKDVGAFSTTIPLAPGITWTNPPSTINRASPLTVTWTGGDPSQTVLILAGSTDQTSKASGGFLCLAPAGAGSFTVPVNALADLVPTTGAATGSSGPIGVLGLMPLQLSNMQKLTPLPTGLDMGVVFNSTMTAQSVQVQ